MPEFISAGLLDAPSGAVFDSLCILLCVFSFKHCFKLSWGGDGSFNQRDNTSVCGKVWLDYLIHISTRRSFWHLRKTPLSRARYKKNNNMHPLHVIIRSTIQGLFVLNNLFKGSGKNCNCKMCKRHFMTFCRFTLRIYLWPKSNWSLNIYCPAIEVVCFILFFIFILFLARTKEM